MTKEGSSLRKNSMKDKAIVVRRATPRITSNRPATLPGHSVHRVSDRYAREVVTPCILHPSRASSIAVLLSVPTRHHLPAVAAASRCCLLLSLYRIRSGAVTRKGVANRGAPSNRPACYRKHQRLGSSATDVTWRSHLEHGSQVRESDALSRVRRAE